MFGQKKSLMKSDRARNILHTRESLDNIGRHFFEDNDLCNFAISGLGDRERFLKDVLYAAQGRIPVIILHNGIREMEQAVAETWTQKFGALDKSDGGPLWACGGGFYEPFVGMEEMDIIQILQSMVKSSGYTCTPQFEKVVKGHLQILRHMDCDYSLSGLNYLCGFEDMEEFSSNIYSLPCSQNEKQLIISNLGITNEKNAEQFDLFRALIRRLAYEAQKSGWNADPEVGFMNITTAMEKCATMLIPVNSNKNPLLMAYICEELKLHDDQRFLLLVDEVRLDNSDIISVLKNRGSNMHFGLVSTNMMELLGVDTEAALSFCEELDRLVLLKHKTATAAKNLAELIGSIEVSKETTTKGTGKKAWEWFADSESESVTVSQEERLRIRPDEILNLGPKQALLFDMATNDIIRF